MTDIDTTELALPAVPAKPRRSARETVGTVSIVVAVMAIVALSHPAVAVVIAFLGFTLGVIGAKEVRRTFALLGLVVNLALLVVAIAAVLFALGS